MINLPWVRRRRVADVAEKLATSEDRLATVRKTLQTVRLERDHDVRLLREIRATGLIPEGDLYRRINCAVAQESE